MFDYNLLIKRLSNSKHSKDSFIKNEIAKRLLKRLDFIKINPENILVTGYMDEIIIELIKTRFADAKIHTYDSDEIDFDLIISNSIIHLTNSINDELDDYYDMLTNDGILLFSTFGDRSFLTLRECFASIDDYPHTNTMIDAMSWGAALQSSKYKTPAIESDVINFTYEQTSTLFEDIRELNEPLADNKMQMTFTGKTKWQQFLKLLDDNKKLEIEALYGYAVKKIDENDSMPRKDPTRMSLEELKKQIAEFKKS